MLFLVVVVIVTNYRQCKIDCAVLLRFAPPTLKSRCVNAAFLLLSIAYFIVLCNSVIDFVVFLYLFAYLFV